MTLFILSLVPPFPLKTLMSCATVTEELTHVTGEAGRTRKERHGDPDDPVNILSSLHQVRATIPWAQ